jgi:DNA-binding MarR family transcriptional regulator
MSQAKCLYVVSVRPGIGMSALADQLHVTPAALSGLVDRLVDHGYLARREDPADRRQLRVSLTDAGSSVMEHIRELNERQLRHLLAGLSGRELESLRTGMAALDRQASQLHDHDLTAEPAGPERTDA